ncbi:MAG: flagellar motor protein MotB [Actinomycetota bacterium]
MAKKELPEDEGPSQEWLASYADAMTLLLAFFIMMFAFALIDEGKFFDFKVGVVAALGIPDPLTDNTDSILSKGTGITPDVGLTPLTPSESQELYRAETLAEIVADGTVTADEAEALREAIQLGIDGAGATDLVEVGVDERGVFIKFAERVLFGSGSAELDDDGLIVLAIVAGVLNEFDNQLEVEGHTDNQPTNGSAFPTNWELSGARAAGVVRWMIDNAEVTPGRLAAVGLADTRPEGNNNTPLGRQENRRVEVVIRLPEGDGSELLDRGGTVVDNTGDGDAPDVIGQDDIVVIDPDADGGDGTGGDGGATETIDPIGDPIGLGGG